MSNSSPLQADEVAQYIRAVLRDGKVILTDHCKNESMRNRSVDSTDLYNALANGSLMSSEWDADRKEWKYRIKGIDFEGDELTGIVILLVSKLQIVVITVF